MDCPCPPASDNGSFKNAHSSTAKPGTVKAEDTFIILQTKDGQSSRKIPFYMFLEQVVGVKLESDIHIYMPSLMDPDSVMSHNESCKSTPRSETDTVKSVSSKESEKNTEEPHVLKSATEHETTKPRGRGRPRKVKAEETQDVKDLKKPLKFVRVNEDGGNKVKSGRTASSQEPQVCGNADVAQGVQPPRRSRRTPSRNSKFKGDFVDSSTLWSKGTSSWNTQLMTLALAAERHETKPSTKHNCIPRKRSNASISDGSDSKVQVTEGAVLEEDCNDMKELNGDAEPIIQEVSVEENDEEMAKGEILETSRMEIESSGQLLKKPLKKALDFVLSETRDAFSEIPLACNSDKGDTASNIPYYVIMDPKLNASGQGLLIQKSGDGINFNVADVSGNILGDILNASPSSYPQERLFACDSCDLAFMSAVTWLQHNEQIHSKNFDLLRSTGHEGKEIHQCPLCEEKFPFEFMLDNHMKKNQHLENTSYVCALCKNYFSNRKERDEHYQLAHPAHKCTVCDKIFDDSLELRRHLKNNCFIVGADGDEEADNYVIEMAKEDKGQGNIQALFQEEQMTSSSSEKVSCDLCGVKFYTYSGLWHHKLDVHQQFYPPGFKEKLLERLEKNLTMLRSTLSFDTNVSREERSQYFVVMQPKWLKSKPQLKVGIENREFRFIVAEDKNGTQSEESVARNTVEAHNPSEKKNILFHCHECGESFQLASSYREHRSQVHGECFETIRSLGAFQCSQCSDTFPCQFMLEEHLKHHDGKKSLPCTLCGLSFHGIQDRREHWRKFHPGIGCPNCGKMYASIKYLQKHISLNCQDHYPASKKFTNSKKKQLNDFEMEETEKKVEKKIIKCHLCPKVCSSIHCWRRHMSERHENDGFSKLSNSCIICHKVIYGYKALEKHLLKEHAEESGLPIEEENSMVKEALSRSKVDLVDYQKAGKDHTNITLDEEGLYHCPQCPKTHPDLKALMIHIKTHVNMQLECSICNKSYKNPTLLKQHVMRHRTKAVYTCSTCGKKFVTLQKLNKHNKVHHSKENFVCELCGMSFTLNDYLLKHKRCHTDKRPHCCSVCGKTFRTKPELRVHVLIHTQETPYVCEHCGRGFTQKGNWRIHLAQHTGHKPHQCNQCELSFALPSHLKRHLLTHNQKVNYRCIWCDKECTQRKHMQMHVTRVHREDFFQYEEQMKLETPVPIAPSQLKMYNRRLGKAGQVRKAYRTRAKKCGTSSQDLIKGIAKEEDMEVGGHCVENLAMETIIEPMVETVTTDLGLAGQDIPQDGTLQILVSGDHQSYAKHNVTRELMGDEPSNVEIVMGDNHEINIIINNGDHIMNSDLAVGEPLEEGSATDVALSHFAEHSSQLHDTLQQAVNALVSGSKGVNGEEAIPLDMESLGHGSDTYAIVYPS